MAVEGLVTLRSNFCPKDTMDRLEAAVKAKGLSVFAHVDHAARIDLPLKIPVWQDASGAIWLSYNDPRWLAKRHGLSADVEATVSALATAILAVAQAATGSQ